MELTGLCVSVERFSLGSPTGKSSVYRLLKARNIILIGIRPLYKL